MEMEMGMGMGMRGGAHANINNLLNHRKSNVGGVGSAVHFDPAAIVSVVVVKSVKVQIKIKEA